MSYTRAVIRPLFLSIMMDSTQNIYNNLFISLIVLDDPLCDGDDQNNGGLAENGPIKNEIVDSSCKSSITDDWTNKNPSDWTQDDAIAWLFTTAKEGGVPEGVITATNNHPPLVDSGAQLARMSLSDYRQKYGPDYGVVFYRAFRQILAVQQHHQMLVNNGPSSQHQHHHQMMTGSNDLTNLQSNNSTFSLFLWDFYPIFCLKFEMILDCLCFCVKFEVISNSSLTFMLNFNTFSQIYRDFTAFSPKYL